MKKRNKISNYDFISAMLTDVKFNHRHVDLDISKANFRVRLRNLDRSIPSVKSKHEGKWETLYIVSAEKKAGWLDEFVDQDVGKEYHLINPQGEKVTIKNASRFCREHSISGCSFSKLMNGKIAQGHCKGWRLNEEKAIEAESKNPVERELTEKEKLDIKRKELFNKFMAA